MARNVPSLPTFSQAAPSLTVSMFHPARLGASIARWLLSQSLGKAAAT